jgi:hypothetical protein
MATSACTMLGQDTFLEEYEALSKLLAGSKVSSAL